jgi:hypothetical protein
VSSLSPFSVTRVQGVTPFMPYQFSDVLPDEADGPPLTRHNLIVPENSWVDMQIPRGVSHQFNALGPNAVIDSVHPEESIETLRESMAGYKMMAQTIFLAEQLPSAETCNTLPTEGFLTPRTEVDPPRTFEATPLDDLTRRINNVVAMVMPPGETRVADGGQELRELDSLAVVDLIVRLEKEFSIEISADRITRQDFASVQSIRDIVCASPTSASGVEVTASPASEGK